MQPSLVGIRKIGPAPKADGDRGNPWIHEWIYNNGTVKRVIVGALK